MKDFIRINGVSKHFGNFVAVDNAGQAMREDQGGALCHQTIQRLLDDRPVLR